MAFERDFGTCCCVFPLKLGVGMIISMYFMISVVCILALFTGDIRYQGNGYNLTWYYAPQVIGMFGLIFGFVGLLGVYDDKHRWLRAFNYWLVARLIIQGMTVSADMWSLRNCDDWLDDPSHTQTYNAAMWAIANEDVCGYAKAAYALGSSLDLLTGCYFTYCCWLYMRIIENNPGYLIDFGLERYDTAARWKMYKARAPYYPPSYGAKPEDEEMPLTGDYGAMEDADVDGMGSFGPDGMPMTVGAAAPASNIFTPATGTGR